MEINMIATGHGRESLQQPLRVPRTRKTLQPSSPLQPLRQAPVPHDSGMATADFKPVPAGHFRVRGGDPLRTPSADTRCSTLRSDIIDYYLHAGNSPIEALKTDPKSDHATDADLEMLDCQLTNIDQVLDDLRTPPKTATVPAPESPENPYSSFYFDDDIPAYQSNPAPLQQESGLPLTATVGPADFPQYATSGFNIVLDDVNDEPTASLLIERSSQSTYKTFGEAAAPKRSRKRAHTARDAELRIRVPPPPPCLPALPTPKYSLFPTITSPGLSLPSRPTSSSTHGRHTSASSASSYGFSDQPVSPLPSDTNTVGLPQKPGLVRLRSSTTSTAPGTPTTTVSSTPTVRPSTSSTAHHTRDSSRWSGDTLSRPLISPASGASPPSDHPSLPLSRRRGTFSTTTSRTTTPHGSVTNSYVSSRKHFSRPLLTLNTFDPIAMSSVFDDDNDDDDDDDDGDDGNVAGSGRRRGWRGWSRGCSWPSTLSGRETEGLKGRRPGAVDPQTGKMWKLWGCCGPRSR